MAELFFEFDCENPEMQRKEEGNVDETDSINIALIVSGRLA